MMSRFVLQESVTVTGVSRVCHISRVSPDRVWVSDGDNLILTNRAGDELHRLTDIYNGFGGHTVNSDGELIYIDKGFNINKLSTDNEVKTTLIKYTAPWRPQCVYNSPSTGDLLVGMRNTNTRTAKLVRYNSTGEDIQTIEHDKKGHRLYSGPIYITENRNGDVIVSDLFRGVMVTERGGRHRFSYRGHPSESRLCSHGICTDPLSHILVCDLNTATVQILDCDGSFLSQMQTSQHGKDTPWSLSYDDKTHLLWVGSLYNNTINIYSCKYGDPLTDSSLQNMKCKKHPADTAVKFCVDCDVPLCVECTVYKEHIRHRVLEIQSIKDPPLQKRKCKRHPINTLVKFCVDCGVPLCVECTISKEHKLHHLIEIQGIKGVDVKEKPASDFAKDLHSIISIPLQQKYREKQITDSPLFESFFHKQQDPWIHGKKQLTGSPGYKSHIHQQEHPATTPIAIESEKIQIGRDQMKEQFRIVSPEDLEVREVHASNIKLHSGIYQQKDRRKQIEEESVGKRRKAGKKERIKERERTSLEKKLLPLDKKLKQLRKSGENELRIQRLMNCLNIETTHRQPYPRYQRKSTEYEDIIQRVDYLHCSGLDFSKAEKQSKSFEPFSQSRVDFLEWMVNCNNVFRKTQSAKCRLILSILFAAYTKEAVLGFTKRKISLFIDLCMDYAFENENHILVLELVRSYFLKFDFNLEKLFKGREISSVVLDTLLQTAKSMLLSKCPRLQQNAISLSLCYDCSQESRLVMMMSYKGIIEMKDGIPEKAMGVNIVLYNYTQPSDEAYTVFNSFVASCSAINLPAITEKDARKLFKKHSNLTLISASPFKSTGYLKGKHRVVEKPCISLLCLHKGYIPIGEREFPKQIHGFGVDVQEGFCFLGSGRSIDFGGHIRRARGINTPGNGSIGGFIDLQNDAVGLITCAHVVFSTDELIIPNSEIQKYVLGNGIDLKVEFFDKNQHNFQVCGNIVDKCFPLSSNNNSVDAALIKLDPAVNEFGFPLTLANQLYSAGFDPNKPPVFTGEVVNVPDPTVSSRIPGKLDSVIKYGSKTGFTIGSLYFNGAHIRFVNETGELPDKTPVHMCNQIEIQSLPHGIFFEPGDSGAFVFCINPDKTLSCIGMAIGSTSKGSCFVTPMVRILDSFGLRRELKPSSSLVASGNNPIASGNPSKSELAQQSNASSEVNLEQILLKLQISVTSMQTSITDVQNQQRSIQSSLNNVQTDVKSLKETNEKFQTEIGTLRTQFQTETENLRTEVGNLRSQVQAEVGNLKTQVQEFKNEFQTKSSGSSLDINQN